MGKDMLLCELQTKDVINVKTAKCLGRVMDLELDEKRGCICTLIVPSKGKICGFFFMNVNTGFHGTRYAVSERI